MYVNTDEDGNEESVYLLMLIKSQLENFDQRRMIRRTWGREFGITSVTVRRVFLLGVNSTDKKTQHRVGLEQQVRDSPVVPSYRDTCMNRCKVNTSVETSS